MKDGWELYKGEIRLLPAEPMINLTIKREKRPDILYLFEPFPKLNLNLSKRLTNIYNVEE